MPLVEVRNLVKHFVRGGGLFRPKTVVRAVDGVSFSIDEGETFVGRIREDWTVPNGLHMWVVADNIIKGAALNAVQIAEVIIKK